MQHVKTRQCSSYGHQELTLEYDPTYLIAPDVVWFASSLERMVASGSRFQAGQSLQIGWLLAWFTSLDDGTLGFEEPDMRSLPIARQPGLTNTLGQLRLQKDTLESVMPTELASFPNLLYSGIVCCNVTANTGFFMSRQTPLDTDSGWFVGCLDKDHDHNDVNCLHRTSLYTLVVKVCPSALAYLAFPPECMIVVDSGAYFYKNDEQLLIRPGSFLDRKTGQQ